MHADDAFISGNPGPELKLFLVARSIGALSTIAKLPVIKVIEPSIPDALVFSEQEHS
jgi:hypothetical protein